MTVPRMIGVVHQEWIAAAAYRRRRCVVKFGLVYLTAVSVLLSAMSSAGAVSKHGGRHHRHPKSDPAVVSGGPSGLAPSHFEAEPARMIEIRPGLWVSSYGCVSDLGNGRWWPCDAGPTGH